MQSIHHPTLEDDFQESIDKEEDQESKVKSKDLRRLNEREKQKRQRNEILEECVKKRTKNDKKT